MQACTAFTRKRLDTRFTAGAVLPCAIRRQRLGFTLVELLTVISVIGILLGLLLPAVLYIRESARRMKCSNNVRQISIGTLHFESTYRHFPGNGWGYNWAPIPERAVGPGQPGGWIYQVLPQLEADNVWGMGKNATGAARAESINNMLATPIAVFACPSRGYQIAPLGNKVHYVNANPTQIARTDYAINEGDWIPGWGPGPLSIVEGDSRNFKWLDWELVSGISSVRFGATIAEITDGTSNTYLCGEKHVGRDSYATADDFGYDQSMLSGHVQIFVGP